MPVEDIDFLKKNSIKQSYVFLVDSKDRNKEAYPDASEYIVEFNPPFHNVIGMNVLDASIPRTMYNVDVYNNQFDFFIHHPDFDLGSLSLSSFTRATLEPGDYTIQTLVVELNKRLNMYLNSNSNLPQISITASPMSNPPDIKNKLQFSCPYPFLFNMNQATMAETLGFDGYVRKSEYQVEPFTRTYDPYLLDLYPTINSNVANSYLQLKRGQNIVTVASNLVLTSNTTYITNYATAYQIANNTATYISNYQLFHSVDIPFQNLTRDQINTYTYTLFQGPKGVIRNYSMANLSLAQKFYVPYHTNLVKIYAALTTNDLSPSSIAHFSIQPDFNGSPSGSNLTTGSIAVSFTDGSLSDSTDLSYSLNANSYYWVVFQSGSNIGMYYNDVLTTNTPLKIYENGTWNSIDDPTNDIYYQFAMQIDVCNDYHSLKGPGIYSLVGERYIILRCKEIEENSYRSLSYSKHTLGLAKFRLGVVGYREERLDYSSVPNREFHPIGKLTRLTLRFETPTGNLYDFKDVNHTITFGIQYLEPTGRVDFSKSIINTNYDGDFMKYQYTQQQQEEDSDDQEIDYNRDDFEKYKLNESRNLPWQVAQRDIQMYYDLNYEEEEDE